MVITYVQELLYQHDFVVVPSFGGFIAGYQPARITADGTLYPPQKEISFNTNVHYNDGLLVQTIMEKQGVSFVQATALLTSNVEEWKKTLHREHTLTLGTLGVFSLISQDILSFESAFSNDFLSTSFGFLPFYFPDIKSMPASLVEPNIPNNVIEFRPQVVSLFNTFKYIVASAAVLLFFILFPIKLTNIPIDYQASICGYRFANQVENTPIVDTLRTDLHVESDILEASVVQDVAKPALSNLALSRERFFIVIGSFQTEQMAQQFVRELPAVIQSPTIVFSDNRYRITAASFDSEQEGEYFLHTFHQNHARFHDAWLLKQ